MTTKTHNAIEIVPILHVDAETSAMMRYAESEQGRARIENARHELRDGKGILVTPAYFADMNRRISKRIGDNHSVEL